MLASSNITLDETPVVLSLDPTETQYLHKLAIMGTLIANKEINQSKVMTIIQKAWKSAGGLSIAILKPNSYLFKFTSEVDKLKILNSGPWNIDGHHLILKHWSRDFLTNKLHFSTTTF
jgi:hypothetical protein